MSSILSTKATKETLIESMNKAIEDSNNYYGVLICNSKSNNRELIIFPRNNFEDKLEYYIKAYNDELKLNNCPDISILAGGAFNYFGSIEFIVLSSLLGTQEEK